MVLEALQFINPNGSLPNIVLVGMLTHIRNIYEFFYVEGKRNRAYVKHYIEVWKNKETHLDMKKWYRQINSHLSHLSYSRVTAKYEFYPVFNSVKWYTDYFIS